MLQAVKGEILRATASAYPIPTYRRLFFFEEDLQVSSDLRCGGVAAEVDALSALFVDNEDGGGVGDCATGCGGGGCGVD